MNNNNPVVNLLVIAVYVLCIYGWFANIYKLTKCDFDTPLKEETIRGIGVVVFPLGVITGYMDIKDGQNKN